MVLLGLDKSKKSHDSNKVKNRKMIDEEYVFLWNEIFFKKIKIGFVRQKNCCIFAHAFSRRNFKKSNKFKDDI